MWPKIKSFFFQNVSVRQTVAKNAFWLAISDIGGRLIRSAIIIYAARVLGASEWGMFSYAVSLAALITIFSEVNGGSLIIRESARLKDQPEERRHILSAAFAAKGVLIAAGILLIFFAFPHFVSGEAKKLLPFVALLFAFDSVRNFGFALVRAAEKMELEAGLYLFTNATVVTLGFVFLSLNSSATYLAFAYTLGSAAGTAAALYVLRSEIKNLFSRFPLRLIKYVFAAGLPLAIAGILGALMIDADILIIGWFRPIAEVGLYSAAQRIVQILYVVPGILAASLLPSFSRFAGKDNMKLKRGLENALLLMYMVAIPMSLGGIILGKEIIWLVFGEEYLAGASAFKILMATLLVNFPATLLASVIFAYDKQKHLIAYAAIGGATNVALDIAIIPQYGIAGSALATLVAQLISNAYLWHVIKPIVQPSVLARLRNIFPASIGMSAFTTLLNVAGVHILLNIGLSVAVYFGLLLFLREPLLKEIQLILSPSFSNARANNEPSSG